jgi:hypothetical protein
MSLVTIATLALLSLEVCLVRDEPERHAYTGASQLPSFSEIMVEPPDLGTGKPRIFKGEFSFLVRNCLNRQFEDIPDPNST